MLLVYYCNWLHVTANASGIFLCLLDTDSQWHKHTFQALLYCEMFLCSRIQLAGSVNSFDLRTWLTLFVSLVGMVGGNGAGCVR